MVTCRHGLVIYGGAYWPETNLYEADEINERRINFLKECSAIMEERTIIE